MSYFHSYSDLSYTLHSNMASIIVSREMDITTRRTLVIFRLCLRKTLPGRSRDYHDANVFEKLRFQKVFLSSLERKAGIFNFIRFDERFRKAYFFETD